MSFEIALSGINAVNSQLSGISNNIANGGTYGFKSSRTNFASTYAGAQPTGSQASSTTQSITRGGPTTSTGRPMDVAIEGQGFFITHDASGNTAYTRVGIFGTDKDGYVVDSVGRRVQGYAVDTSGARGAMGDLKVPQGQIAAKASDAINFVANMSAGWKTPAGTFDKDQSTSYNASMVTAVYDSLGNTHNVTQYFVKTSPTTVTVHYAFDGTALPTTNVLTFDTTGAMVTPAAPVAVNCGTPPGAAALSVNFNYSGTTSYAGDASTTVNSPNGFASGLLTGVKVENSGDISATYSNGQKQSCGILALASFPNENGLVQTNNTSWTSSPASGAAIINVPGTGLAGKLISGSLEQSNVDMTAELVNLMESQRTYQANTKVISTENQMMQALMQAI